MENLDYIKKVPGQELRGFGGLGGFRVYWVHSVSRLGLEVSSEG